MNAIINKIEGADLTADKCEFCECTKDIKVFGIINEKVWNGYKFKAFGICAEHLKKLNSLLEGSNNIDKIFTGIAPSTSTRFNLRK